MKLVPLGSGMVFHDRLTARAPSLTRKERRAARKQRLAKLVANRAILLGGRRAFNAYTDTAERNAAKRERRERRAS